MTWHNILIGSTLIVGIIKIINTGIVILASDLNINLSNRLFLIIKKSNHVF